MTPADKRILELVDRWLTSLDLHLKYAQLDDAAYWQIQAWPKHDRPTRWILELARQKTLELKSLCQSQTGQPQTLAAGKFAEALELMNFLSNLVGAQHVQRFIPTADPAKENGTAAETTAQQPAMKAATSSDSDSTREMPRPKVAAKRGAAGSPAKTAHSQHRTPAASPAPPANQKPVADKPVNVSVQAQETVIADAVRLLKWGRQWHELAELIARMAERPALTEVRRILRARKSEIEGMSAG